MLLGVNRILRPRVFGSDLHTKWNGVHHRPFLSCRNASHLENLVGNANKNMPEKHAGEPKSRKIFRSRSRSRRRIDLTDLTSPVTLSGKTLIRPRLGASFSISIGKRRWRLRSSLDDRL